MPSMWEWRRRQCACFPVMPCNSRDLAEVRGLMERFKISRNGLPGSFKIVLINSVACSVAVCGSYGAQEKKLVHERKIESGGEISQNIRRYMVEIEGLKEKKFTSSIGSRSNLLDANTRAIIQFDAAFDNRSHKSASSLVVWSRTRELLALKIVVNTNVPSPFAAEAYARLQAVQLGISMAFPSITVMGDSRTVIKKCQSKNSDKSNIGAIIRDIQSSMTHFQEIKFQFIKRTENAYAHNLAKESLRKNKETYQRRADLTHRHSPQIEVCLW
ncbi:glycine, alanine and asparagine-rich protein-like [Gossypium australe]|uniref:Glycine, alanine and asparagine-rich protein-like n=1 Tax=Gossypium australe TaxID=47621 RepID=A0A5B6UQM5_9ROSI|nr:glycine, alanine and asparagine-rich protein-like [Gossypium australe]